MNQWRQYSVQEKIILITSFAIVLPFFISGPIFVISFFLLCYINKNNLWQIIRELHEWWLFFIFALIIALYHYNFIGSLVIGAFIVFALYFKLYRKIVTKPLFIILMKSMSGLGSLVSIHAIYTYWRYITKQQLDWSYILTTSNPQFRVESTLFNANYFGLFIILVYIINVYLFSITKKKVEWIKIMVIMLLNTIALLLTASRMLLPSLLVGLFVLLWFNYRKLAWGTFFFGGILMVSFISNPNLLPRFESLAYGFEDRFSIWENGWSIFLTYPLTGRGAQSYMKYYYLFTDDAKMHAHQLLIDTLANYGIYGVLLLINALIGYLRNLFIQLSNMSNLKEISLIFACFTVVLFHGIMDVSIVWLQTAYVFLLVVSVPIEKLNDERE